MGSGCVPIPHTQCQGRTPWKEGCVDTLAFLVSGAERRALWGLSQSGAMEGARAAMPMPADEIVRLIKEALPDAEIRLVDTAGDQNHYAAEIVSEAFRGKSMVQQHQMVYAALKGRMGDELHALSLTTRAPD